MSTPITMENNGRTDCGNYLSYWSASTFFFFTELGNSSLKENWQEGSDKYTTHNPQALTWQAESCSQELHEPAWAVLQLESNLGGWLLAALNVV